MDALIEAKFSIKKALVSEDSSVFEKIVWDPIMLENLKICNI